MDYIFEHLSLNFASNSDSCIELYRDIQSDFHSFLHTWPNKQTDLQIFDTFANTQM